MAKERKSEFTIYCIKIIWDAFFILMALYLSFWVRFYSGFFMTWLGVPNMDSYSRFFPAVILIMVTVLHNHGLYSKNLLSQQTLGIIRLWKAISIAILLLMALTFAVQRMQEFSRLVMVIFWFSANLLLSFGRLVFRHLENNYMHHWHKKMKVVVIGLGPITKHLLDSSKKYPHWRREIVGFIALQNDHQSDFEGLPVLGSIDDFQSIIEQNYINEVVLALQELKHEDIVKIILECERRLISFKMVPDMFEILTSQVDVQSVDGIPLLGLKEFPLERVFCRIIKRLFDIAGSAFGLLIMSPVFIVISILIKLTSRGAIFYLQERVGENGKRFTMIKFRTMCENAEKETGPVWATADDERKTWIGYYLRQWNLDELPQLWNVLKGHMSLVGPRPERPNFVEEFKNGIPRYMSRHQIKSGMTGWAQVNGLRGNTSVEERIKFDLYYLENWSVWLDFKIILMTFLSRKNAY